MHSADINSLDWSKSDGLLPAIVQDSRSGDILMLGFVNHEALAQTLATGNVTFFSRTRNRLWQKGETSGHTLKLVRWLADCDNDTVLFTVEPKGPTCHTGTRTCFGNESLSQAGFIFALEQHLHERAKAKPEESYTAKLLTQGVKRIAQKVGEEGVETALAATGGTKDELIAESADLIYHLLVLLHAKDANWSDVVTALRSRKK